MYGLAPGSIQFGGGSMQAQQFRDRLGLPPPKTAFGGDREAMREFVRGGETPLHPFNSSGEMNEAERDFRLGAKVKPRQWGKIGIVRAISRDGHVDEVDRATDRASQAVRHLDQVSHVRGFDRMAVIVVAVTKVE